MRSTKSRSKKDLGFKQEQIITAITKDGKLRQNYKPLKEELLKHPLIFEVTVSLDLPTTIQRYTGTQWSNQEGEQSLNFCFTYTDDDFMKFYEMEVLQGRTFSKSFPTDLKQAVVINETAAKTTGWDVPVGKNLKIGGQNWTVIGVVKDFHFRSLHKNIEPLLFRLQSAWPPEYFSIKISPNNIKDTLSFIEKKWQQFSPGYPFDYAFLDERINLIYKTEQKLAQNFIFFTVVAVFIACLGLLGLSSFSAEQKRKEIGIRKVLGASIQNILRLQGKEFIKCISFAALIAWPIAYYAMNKWLQNFTHRVSIGVGTFVLSTALALVFAFLAVFYQALKASLADPVQSLRYE